ncbi:pilus assembly protein FimV [Gammaproteobacteria bacterium]
MRMADDSLQASVVIPPSECGRSIYRQALNAQHIVVDDDQLSMWGGLQHPSLSRAAVKRVLIWWKLSLVMAVVAVLLPNLGYSLGLGNISVHSTLNQPLFAEIEVFAEDKKELTELKARLAGIADFQRSGLERPLVLSRLRFEITRRSNGKTVIAVRSTDSIKEPFLNFLLEINWPSGRLLREYAVLLDPPRLFTRPSAIQFPSREADNDRTPKEISHFDENQNAKPRILPEHYGPVRRDETLWRIATSLRPDSSVSNQQVMMALFNANREFFEGDNINGLKTGSILSVPTIDQMLALRREESVAELRRHQQVWRERRGHSAEVQFQTKSAIKSDKTVQDTLPGETSAELRLVSPVQNDKKADSAPHQVARKEPSNTVGDDTNVVATLRQQVDLAQEISHTNQKENEELRGRVIALEGQISGMQQMLKTKDENLAALQSQLALLTPAAATPSVVNKISEPSPSVSLSHPVAPMPVTNTTTPPVNQPVNVPTTIVTAATESHPSSQVYPSPPSESDHPAAITPITAIAPVVSKKIKQVSPPTNTDSLLDLFLFDPTLLVLVTTLFGTVVILGILLIRRRRSETIELPETSINIPDVLDEIQSEVDSIPLLSPVEKFQGASTPQPWEILQNKDSLKEAESYISLGRNQHAVDITRQAPISEPNQTDYGYASTGGTTPRIVKLSDAPSNFNETLVTNVKSAIVSVNPPDDLMTAQATLSSSAETMEFDLGLLENMDDDFEREIESSPLPSSQTLGIPNAATSSPTTISTPTKVNTLDSMGADELDDLFASLNAEVTTSAMQNVPAPLKISTSVKDDIDISSIPELAVAKPADKNNSKLTWNDLKTSQSLINLDESMEFDLIDINNPLSSAITKSFSEISFPAATGEFFLPGEEQRQDIADAMLSDSLTTFELDKLPRFMENKEQRWTTLEPELNNGLNDGVNNRVGIDEEQESLAQNEIGTKLDLAQFYLDIGDKEGAQEALQEVIKEGNPTQRRMAEELLAKIT